jgi:Arc/MetJ-type ribon-helix-helix transcriptional regulator
MNSDGPAVVRKEGFRFSTVTQIMEVPMDPEIERVVREKVARGDYPSVAELVEEALYLLVERDWSRSQAELQERVPSVFEAMTETPTGADQP